MNSKFRNLVEERRQLGVRYNLKEKISRILWYLSNFMFRFSPGKFNGWRRFLLKIFGAKVGKGVYISPSCRIFAPWNLEIDEWTTIGAANLYNLGKIKIGRETIISQGAHLCAGTHDFEDSLFPLLKSNIIIDNTVWICADAFVGPGIQIHNGVVLGARAVATKDLSEWSVYAGNPAKYIKKRILKK